MRTISFFLVCCCNFSKAMLQQISNFVQHNNKFMYI
ncbi:hypothetical protein GYH30_033798 [Glycine max]|nr:hypothetical protein GYH30_033798 [Glycine max]